METRGEKIERLGEFLLNSFMALEFDEFPRVGGYDQVANTVRPDVGANTYFSTVVQALDQQGLINDEFFAPLRRGRPGARVRFGTSKKPGSMREQETSIAMRSIDGRPRSAGSRW